MKQERIEELRKTYTGAWYIENWKHYDAILHECLNEIERLQQEIEFLKKRKSTDNYDLL